MSRGVGAAANFATLHALSSASPLNHMPTLAQTAFSSLFVASFRLLYYPLDTAKTIMQVEGRHGLHILRGKVRREGLGSLYHGASFSILGAALRHTLWFGTYNILVSLQQQHDELQQIGDGITATHTSTASHASHPSAASLSQILNNAGIGLACSLVTDIIGNPISMLKAYRQTQEANASYVTIAREVIRQHGIHGFFLRGLGTRLWVDALNSIVFTVVWRILVPDERLGHGGSR